MKIDWRFAVELLSKALHFDRTEKIVLTEAFYGPIFETSEGNQYGICMRDDTIEITVIGDAPLPRVTRNGETIFLI